MKKQAILAAITLFIGAFGLQAQQTVTVRATSYDISDNLDLEAVASLFGESRNLEEFEQTLNDPEMQLSNLDLNRDGYVDYLRVIESNEEGVHLIVIQAVLDRDLFQDVATIDVERRSNNRVVVQVIGNDYLYGPNYIIEPVYVHRPVIFNVFWRPRYSCWVSPYYWGYYPVYYNYRAPRPTFAYCRGVYGYVNVRNTYNYVNVRYSVRAQRIYNRAGRNDYARRYPQRSFAQRNKGVVNKRQLTTNRTTVVNRANGSQTVSRTTTTVNTRTVQKRSATPTASSSSRSQSAPVRATQSSRTSSRTSATRSTASSRSATNSNSTRISSGSTRSSSTSGRSSASRTSASSRSASKSSPTRISSSSTRSSSGSSRSSASRSSASSRSSVNKAPQRISSTSRSSSSQSKARQSTSSSSKRSVSSKSSGSSSRSAASRTTPSNSSAKRF